MEYTFNKFAQLKRSEFKAELAELAKYRDFIEAGEKTEKRESSGREISQSLIEYGSKIQSEIAVLHEKIKEKIVRIMYNLSPEQVDNMTIEEYDTCINHINTERPEIFKLFLIKVL